jgi:hypothetical protein
MFFLSLFQSTTANENVPDVAPSNTAVQDEVGELAKQLQSGLVGPDNAGVAEQVSEISKQLQSALVGPANAGVISQIGELAKQFQSAQLGPTNSALLEQIAQLRKEVQGFYLLPPSQSSIVTTTGGVTSVDGSGGTTGLTLTGGPITSTGTLTLGGTLGTANGGTGSTSTTFVNLASNVTGVLPIANGGTNSTSTTFVNLASNVTGVLPIANGGIGASSFASAGLPTLSGSNTFSGVMTTTGQNNQFTALTYATTNGSGGVNAYLGESSAFAVVGGVNGVVLASGSTFPGTARYSADSVSFRPYASSSYSLGTSSQRWTSVYANELVAGASGAAQYKENSSFAFVNGTNGVVTAFNGTGITVTQATGFRPFADNTYTLGTSGQRWSEVYAANGTINTSDATEKQQVRELDDAERRTAQRIKGLIRAFKWNEAVESKGDGARIHFGVMAQDVEAAFAAEGLDATKYGLFCRDTWDTLDGNSQTRLGVRYEELLAFVIGSL